MAISQSVTCKQVDQKVFRSKRRLKTFVGRLKVLGEVYLKHEKILLV